MSRPVRDRLRAAWAALASPARLAGLLSPRAPQEVAGLRYGPHPRQRLDLALPRGAGPATPMVAFLHGGSWYQGGRGEYRFVARALAAEGFAVAIPDYRLWPEARWPDFLRDNAAALAWLRSAEARAAGAPAGPLVAMGHSAGGFNAAALALDPRWLAEAGLEGGRAALAGCIAVAAPIAWQPTEEPVRSIFAPAPGGRIAAIADPADLAGAPPMLLLHGTADEVVGPFHSADLAAALRAAGRKVRHLELEGMGHIAPMVALSAPARRFGLARAPVLEEITAFLRDLPHPEG